MLCETFTPAGNWRRLARCGLAVWGHKCNSVVAQILVHGSRTKSHLQGVGGLAQFAALGAVRLGDGAAGLVLLPHLRVRLLRRLRLLLRGVPLQLHTGERNAGRQARSACSSEAQCRWLASVAQARRHEARVVTNARMAAYDVKLFGQKEDYAGSSGERTRFTLSDSLRMATWVR